MKWKDDEMPPIHTDLKTITSCKDERKEIYSSQ